MSCLFPLLQRQSEDRWRREEIDAPSSKLTFLEMIVEVRMRSAGDRGECEKGENASHLTMEEEEQRASKNALSSE